MIASSITTQNVRMEICVHLGMNHWQFTNLLFASFGCKEIVQKPTAVLDTCIWKEIEVKSHVFGTLNQVDVRKQIAHFYMRNQTNTNEENKTRFRRSTRNSILAITLFMLMLLQQYQNLPMEPYWYCTQYSAPAQSKLRFSLALLYIILYNSIGLLPPLFDNLELKPTFQDINNLESLQFQFQTSSTTL